MEEELVFASSSIGSAIGCWAIESGKEQQLPYKSCGSTPPHGLSFVGSRFLASSQFSDHTASFGSIIYCSLSKRQAEVKSFLGEPIKPIAATSDGTYLVGGGISGNIYLWEVPTGRLLQQWHAHLRPITCLVFSDDDSLLVSAAEDGCVRVWPLLTVVGVQQRDQASNLYLHSFAEHTLPITDLVMGHGGGNAVIISASEDRSCKIWSLSKGVLLRSLVFPSIINALALDSWELVFYAGGRDGNVYTAALNASTLDKSDWPHIIGSFPSQSNAVTSLAYSGSRNKLLAGLDDGFIRVWDPKTRNFVCTFKQAKGPVNNILVMKRPQCVNPWMSAFTLLLDKGGPKSLLPPPKLQKYPNLTDDLSLTHAVINLPRIYNNPLAVCSFTLQMIDGQLKGPEQNDSSVVAKIEVEKLKHDCAEYKQMLDKWKRRYDALHEFCMDELLAGDRPPKRLVRPLSSDHKSKSFGGNSG
ncbi:unnamed protein product [Linum tenue]|uniref:Uncharacterized protein n=1 Tax=Linum tenue TaxID=586396 RepID=A0AAV0RM81_9ROSI|nr:unnamed protein product [Linum tenue]